jgi:hypothetical protein
MILPQRAGPFRVWISAPARDSCLFQFLYIGSGSHTAPCAKDSARFLSRGKAPIYLKLVLRLEFVESYRVNPDMFVYGVDTNRYTYSYV